MSQLMITFSNPEEVLDFVNRVAKYPFDMDMKRGRFVVDAKSILGIMNLGFNHPIELKIYEEDCEDLKKEISKYRAA
ncbi:HPr family phosphocarrier protein [Luxibacter massiliensis]|uniref:HPr family phosphocarrier protein n=1 Tax=Luxibacter massiliensis TaxID=2219695 RepID=UPI000F064CB1|nr:HPr family phosphocarrier protein [Luxibacter massiliensis]